MNYARTLNPLEGKTNWLLNRFLNIFLSVTPVSNQAKTPENNISLERKHPIPAPSYPRQYRAIGLVQGEYQQSEELLTRGKLLTIDGTVIDSVILGKAISLIKNHIDLAKSHLWVVYPRINTKTNELQLQIVGVWEPETLSSSGGTSNLIKSDDSDKIEHGYFSVRGEVIFSDTQKQTIIVKIRQAGKKESEKPKFFKLKLQGMLPERPINRFWDLQVQLKGNLLVIVEAIDLGLLRKTRGLRPKKTFQEQNKESLQDLKKNPFPKKRIEGISPPSRSSLPKPSKILKRNHQRFSDI